MAGLKFKAPLAVLMLFVESSSVELIVTVPPPLTGVIEIPLAPAEISDPAPAIVTDPRALSVIDVEPDEDNTRLLDDVSVWLPLWPSWVVPLVGAMVILPDEFVMRPAPPLKLMLGKPVMVTALEKTVFPELGLMLMAPLPDTMVSGLESAVPRTPGAPK